MLKKQFTIENAKAFIEQFKDPNRPVFPDATTACTSTAPSKTSAEYLEDIKNALEQLKEADLSDLHRHLSAQLYRGRSKAWNNRTPKQKAFDDAQKYRGTPHYEELMREIAAMTPRVHTPAPPIIIFDEMTDYKPVDWDKISPLVGNGMSFIIRGPHDSLIDDLYADRLKHMDPKIWKEQYECTFEAKEPTNEEVTAEYAKCQAEYRRRERTSASRNPRSKPWERF